MSTNLNLNSIEKTQNVAKAAYSSPRLTVHGTVESLTQTGTCAVHHRTNCCICSCPSS